MFESKFQNKFYSSSNFVIFIWDSRKLCTKITSFWLPIVGISLGMRPANERRRYNVTTSFIDWVHTMTDLYICYYLCRRLPWLPSSPRAATVSGGVSGACTRRYRSQGGWTPAGHQTNTLCAKTTEKSNDQSLLTHWGQDKMDAIFQTTFSNTFSWMKMYEFQLRFH